MFASSKEDEKGYPDCLPPGMQLVDVESIPELLGKGYSSKVYVGDASRKTALKVVKSRPAGLQVGLRYFAERVAMSNCLAAN